MTDERKNENIDVNAETESKGAGKSRKGLIIGAAIAAVAVVIAVATFMLTNGGGKASAESIENCQLQVEALKAHQEDLKTTQETADKAAKLTAKNVEDPSVIKDLKSAQAEVDKLGDAPTCPTDGSQQQVDEAIESIREYADDMRGETSSLDAAAKAVIASNEALTGADSDAE